jgi:glutaredoxin 3
MANENLILYYSETCWFCRKVIDFLKQKSIVVPMKEIYENTAARDELIQVGGKQQVPCLFIDGKPLYESDDIIAWFDKNKGSK